MIVLTPRHNRQNDGMYLERDDPRRDQLIHQERAFDAGVHLWVGLHSKAGIIGLYFIDEIPVAARLSHSLNSARYIWLIENRIIPDLRTKLSQEDFEKCWFQPDGASAHRSNNSLEVVIHHFGQRVIARRSQIEWPPHSPDLVIIASGMNLEVQFLPITSQKLYRKLKQLRLPLARRLLWKKSNILLKIFPSGFLLARQLR